MYQYDLTTRRGETFTQTLIIKQGGEPLDLTGAEAKSQIRNDKGPGFVKDITCTVEPDGRVLMGLTAAETSAINAGVYKYDLLVKQGENVTYYIGGAFTVEATVTQLEERRP